MSHYRAQIYSPQTFTMIFYIRSIIKYRIKYLSVSRKDRIIKLKYFQLNYKIRKISRYFCDMEIIILGKYNLPTVIIVQEYKDSERK